MDEEKITMADPDEKSAEESLMRKSLFVFHTLSDRSRGGTIERKNRLAKKFFSKKDFY